MNQPATPLPWTAFKGFVNSGGGEPVANMHHEPGLYEDERRADAAYVAHAGNAYPRLVESVLALGVALSAAAEDIPDIPLGSRSFAIEMSRQAHDLLAELGEEV